ncbi:MAG TPA: DUF1501 domain-containing protein [Pirellulaceae bacterium]|jgi:hypothetical protein|nr:DUF1501 domain-containing protein [Pirellulaceae bacterium]
MSPFHDDSLRPSRRAALKSLASGFGYLAFAALAQRPTTGIASPAGGPLAAKETHFPARAKRVIFLCMNGGPSHVDLFDYKPKLNDAEGRRTADSPLKGNAALMPSPFRFARHGQSGQWISELMPELAKQADDLCFVKSMHTDLPNHAQAFLQMHTGSFQFTRPSLGSWSLYGLGSANQNLPGFVTINPPTDNGGARNYGNAFLPAVYQATKIGANQTPGFYAAILGVDQEPGPPLRNVDNEWMTKQEQRRQLDFLRDLDSLKLERDERNPEVEGAIESFELAFRMQDELPALLDLSGESQTTLDDYGIGPDLPTARFGRQCLLARRLAESGVRFIEITAPGSWDHHFQIDSALKSSCQATDLPVAALLRDLKQRGMLEETLVIWAGEFGRTPYAQSGTGRDHNNKGYTLWMAGGGVRGGLSYGSTDELGYQAVENPVHIHDWHATILHLLGFDHERLTFEYAGRDYRLTDVHGRVVTDLVA